MPCRWQSKIVYPAGSKNREITNVVDFGKNGCFNGGVIVDNQLICIQYIRRANWAGRAASRISAFLIHYNGVSPMAINLRTRRRTFGRSVPRRTVSKALTACWSLPGFSNRSALKVMAIKYCWKSAGFAIAYCAEQGHHFIVGRESGMTVHGYSAEQQDWRQ